jgi:ribose transport system permease protein/AI-2 transport system permease protein
MRRMMRAIPSFNGRELTLAGALLIALVVFSAASPYFATADNLATVMRNCVELLLVGLGMTLLLAMGAIDVSVGMTMGLAAIVVGRLLAADANPAVVAISGPVVGGLLGLFTATIVVIGRIPAIVGTLGLLGFYRAAIFLSLGGEWLSGLPTRLTALLSTSLAGAPLSVVVIVMTYLAVWLAIRRTPYGPHLLAIGNDEEKARLSGVAVARVRFATFVISGLLCGLAATFYVSTYRNVEMTIGGSLALDAIAAVVLGGTSVLGGRCSLVGTVLGVVLLRVLQNGLLLTGVPSLWQTVVTGALLLIILAAEVVGGNISLQSLRWGAR